MFGQLSLFESDLCEYSRAVCCWGGTELDISAPKNWILEIVPAAKYAAEHGGHLMVLKPTKLKKETIPGHLYRHYQIGGKVFEGVFIN